eukprot:TRINITY_DN9317_c0_g1_i1.p1 TRINITY_DN9317_c0_g1~~TRINITY_DN9317_c0_g1_i1.p1  ORF type:complete len:650 (-),score=211.22 TRINITY_DN9317_c0_g1_i1:4-1716(-)
MDEDEDYKRESRREDYDPRKRRDDRYDRKRGRDDDRYDRRRGDYDDDRRGFRDRKDRYEPIRAYEGDGRMRKPKQRYDRFEDRSRPRGRCRDYDEKGFCIRGETCPYDHGSGFVVTDQVGLEQMRGTPRNNMMEPSYDPDKPNLPKLPWETFQTGNFVGPEAYQLGMFKPSEDVEDAIQVGGRGMYPKRKNQSSYPSDKSKKFKKPEKFDPTTFHTKNTLAITNLPSDLNTIEQLNSHFKQFGNIVNIQLRPNQSKAFIQFENYFDAKGALSSPEAVLNNRFIKVFWANKMKDEIQSEIIPKKEFVQKMETVSPKIEKPKVDVKSLQKEKGDIRKQQLEQAKALLESMSKLKNIDPKEKSELTKRISSLTMNVADSLAKDSSTLEKKVKEEKTEENSEETKETEVERLQKRYNSLKNMAANLGIDSESTRGGSLRGRGTRGRGRGRGRPTKRTMTLDNRSKTLNLTLLPEELRDPKSLENHFTGFGDLIVNVDGENASVEFSSRRSAEMALSKARSFKSNPLNVSWAPKTNVPEKDQMETSQENEANGEAEYEDYEGGEEEGDDERSWKH